jgi:hypothetical protein
MALRHPSLSVDLPSVGSSLLLLLVDLLPVLRELHFWLRRCHLYRDRRDGQEGQSVLRIRCVNDGVRRGLHIAPSGDGGSRAPSGAGCADVLTRGLLHEEGDPPWIIPMNMASKSCPYG